MSLTCNKKSPENPGFFISGFDIQVSEFKSIVTQRNTEIVKKENNLYLFRLHTAEHIVVGLLEFTQATGFWLITHGYTNPTQLYNYAKICKKQGGWVKDRRQKTEDRRQKTEDRDSNVTRMKPCGIRGQVVVLLEYMQATRSVACAWLHQPYATNNYANYTTTQKYVKTGGMGNRRQRTAVLTAF